MRNAEFRLCESEDLTRGRIAYCYYLSPDPIPSAMGTIVSDPESDGWVEVATYEGKRHHFNADRLAVKR